MKRILFLITTLNMGGAEHVLVDIANQMANDGYDVTVRTLLDEGYYQEKLQPNVHYCGGFRLKTKLVRKVVIRLLLLCPGRLLNLFLNGKKYSHMVAFLEGVPTKIIAKCKPASAKKIGWIHTDLSAYYGLDKVFGSLDNCQKSYMEFDHLVCVSGDAKRGFLKKVGQHKSIGIQYNPINKIEILQKSMSEPAYEVQKSDTFRLVAVGRLDPVKGFDLLIEAMTTIRECANRPVALYIIGGGKEETSLKQKISQLQLEDAVFLCGQQNNPYSIMSRCDLQVVSSRAEGFPLCLSEGHLLGLPAVATQCSGPKEILADSGAGILVDISTEGLAEGIIKMINDAELFWNCKQNAVAWSQNYNEADVYAQIKSIFD